MEPLRVSLCRKVGYLERLGLAEASGQVALLLAAALPGERVHRPRSRPERAREAAGLAGGDS